MHIQFAELPVFDQERAKAFYVEQLHCQVVADEPMGDKKWRWIELRLPGGETTLHFLRRRDESPSDGPVLVLVDDDVVGTVERLRSGGVEITSEAQNAPWQAGRMVAEFRDSEGNRIMLGSA